jgi:hypothetical protein
VIFIVPIPHSTARLYALSTNVFTRSGNCDSWINTWVHHVYVDRGGEVRAYVNGSRIDPESYDYRSLDGMTINRFGSRPGFGTNGLAGYLDDLAIFDRALTEDEIELVYQQAWENGVPLRF